MSNVASRTHKKEKILQLWGSFTQKPSRKRLAPERGNSMAWRAEGHRFSTCVGVITSRMVLQLIWGFDRTSHWLRDAPGIAFMHVWESCPATPGLSTEKASQKPGRETGKQHGLASPRRPFLDLRWGDLQCQTLRPKPRKKRRFYSWRLQFAPRIGFGMHLDLR